MFNRLPDSAMFEPSIPVAGLEGLFYTLQVKDRYAGHTADQPLSLR